MSELAQQLIAKAKATKAKRLDLGYCGLTTIPMEVFDLVWLEELYLCNSYFDYEKWKWVHSENKGADNVIAAIPTEIERLKELKVLYCGGGANRKEYDLVKFTISDISSLKYLPQLNHLDLSGNDISDIDVLKNLSKLNHLNLCDNNISDIDVLKYLTLLNHLELSGNDISDIDVLKNLSKLNHLDLRYNNICDIDVLKYLSQLNHLDLSDNNISNIDVLKYLTLLNHLDLFGNNIKTIPATAILALKQLEYINLKYNLIENLSPEIITQGIRGIRAHFQGLAEQGKDYIYEAKLLIIGDGDAGKTSLAWKMKDINATMPEKGNDRTKGIDIQALPIDNLKKEADKPFLMNIWDFGGQGYYHSTHQFFLTKRSLYIIVNNTRTNKTDFNHWLQTVSVFSEDSPVIIVENEVGGAPSEFDLRGYQRYFNNILYAESVDISNATDGRLQKLIDKICISIQQLPHVGSELPKQWVKIREELAEVAKTEAHIPDRTFKAICKKHQITKKEDIRLLGDLFHDLGVFLYFRTDESLKRTVILQNAWATKGVYEILDNTLVREQHGYFTITQAEAIWEGTEFEDMHHELVQLMRKFELCYRIPYTNAPVAYLSPNLLPVERPDYDWNMQHNLIIYYEYDFMPKGLLGRLIVRLHRHVKDIQKEAWRNGCVFQYEGTEAQVIETYGNKKLEIRVQGQHCVRLSSIIIREIDVLNAGFKRIKVEKLFPCNCSTCRDLEVPHFYDYANLMNRKAKGKRTVECDKSFDDVPVLEILEGVYNAAAAEERSVQDLIANGNIREAIDVLEQTHTHEGTLLLLKYNKIERLYHLGMMTDEQHRVLEQQIASSLIVLSKRTAKQQPVTVSINNDLKQVDKSLNEIQAQLQEQDVLLNTIIAKSETQQHELVALLTKIDQQQDYLSDALAANVIEVVQRGMADFESKAPQATDIIKQWQAAAKELDLQADSKAKLKFVLPFLFIKFEKELTWKGKDWFKAIREDIQRGRQGKWTEMFVYDAS